MAGHTVDITTISTLSKTYKRSTTKLYRTYTRKVPEYRWMDEVPDEDIVPSGRENLIPLDTQKGYGAAQIPDGGWESRAETPPPTEGAFVFNHTNNRFSITLRAQAFDRAARGATIIRQIKYQSIKCIEGVMRKYGFMFYGFSTGVVAVVNGDPGAAAASHTITLKDAFGITTIDTASYLASMFVVGEGVALIRASALVANAIGEVTAVTPATPSIAVTWIPGNADPADGDQIVYANAVTGQTIEETDYNKWNVGIFDVLTSVSVHGVSNAVEPTWNPALYNTSGGSLDFVKIKAIRQALENSGDTTLRRIIYSNGVENDFQATERGALLWTNSGQMNVDANVSAKGVDFRTSRFTPPTCAFGIGADAFGKKIISEKPDEEELIEFGKLYKAEDRSVLKGGVDMIGAQICRSRSRFTGYVNLNEQ